MPDTAKSFADKLVDILNYGSLNLAMGLGYRLGLFEIMDAAGQPLSIAEICEKKKLDRRYVREWLGVMVCGGIVELVEDARGKARYFLPPDRGDVLTRRAGNANLGVYSQEIPLLTACALERVYQGFLSGEGIPYESYPEFHDFMGELGDAKHRQVLVNTFLPSVDEGRLVEALRQGIEVCDLGCAQGVATVLMARAFPASHFTGIDISAEALDSARAQAAKMGLCNIVFEELDAAELRRPNPFSGRFDYTTAFDAIHDQTRPLEALQGILEILKPGGAFSMIDIAAESDITGNRDHPMGAFLYAVSLMHCLPVGLVDGGAGLGMMWGRQKAVEMLHQAGFGKVTVLEMSNDPFNLHFYCRKPNPLQP